jgi:ABC-type nitrate/sulfonate/bicarbonate transport system substrate-binding protein
MRPTLPAVLLLFILLAPAAAIAADKLTVALDGFVNPNHALLIVALQKGWFVSPPYL